MQKISCTILTLLALGCSNQSETDSSMKYEETMESFTNVDKGYFHQFENDTLKGFYNDSLLFSTYILPKQYYSKDSLTYSYDHISISDSLYIVLRNVYVANDFIDLGSMENVDIYNFLGKIPYNPKDYHWRMLYPRVFGDFKDEWEVQVDHGEGMVLEVNTLINGKSTSVDWQKLDIGYEQQEFSGFWLNDTTFRYPKLGSTPRHADVSLDVFKSGRTIIYCHQHPDDTLRFITNEFEFDNLPIYQFYNVFYTDNNGVFKVQNEQFRYLFKHPEISGTTGNGWLKNLPSHYQNAFILTGVDVCSNPTVAQENISLNRNDSILIHDEMSLVFISRNQTKIHIKKYNQQKELTYNRLLLDLATHDEYHSNDEIPVSIQWIGDIDCDNINEAIIHYEVGNTIYDHFIKSDVQLEYQTIATNSLYWD